MSKKKTKTKPSILKGIGKAAGTVAKCVGTGFLIGIAGYKVQEFLGKGE